MKLKEIKTRTIHYFEDELGRRQGELILRYEEKPSQIKSINNYVDGIKVGTSIDWYMNGKIRTVANYVNELKEGNHAEWHESGNKRSRTFYKDGSEHGEYMDWHANGQLWEHVFLIDSAENGESIIFDIYGNVTDHDIFVNGTIIDVPIPTCEEEQFLLCLEYGHMEFFPIGMYELTASKH